MTFAQRRNRLTTHFSERIPFVKRRVAVFTSWIALQKKWWIFVSARWNAANSGRPIWNIIIASSIWGHIYTLIACRRHCPCHLPGWHTSHTSFMRSAHLINLSALLTFTAEYINSLAQPFPRLFACLPSDRFTCNLQVRWLRTSSRFRLTSLILRLLIAK